MGMVFGRNGGPHAFDQAIDELSRHPDPGPRAVACNLQHDHRVSPEREAVFHFVVQQVQQGTSPRRPAGVLGLLIQRLLQGGLLSGGGSAIDGSIMQEALTTYHEAYVRTRRRPDFLLSPFSRRNRLDGRSGLRPEDWLVHAKDLNSLKVYEFASETENQRRWPLLAGGPTAASRKNGGPDLSAWLTGNLDVRRRPRAHRDKFLTQLLDAEAAFRRERKKEAVHEPCWASRLSDFEEYVDLKTNPPERWLQALGMSKNPDRWILFLKYQVHEAGTIFRPTQLDAGWNGNHFPSPPCVPLDQGGHPMDIGMPPDPPVLLPEYIHRQLNFQLRHKLKLVKTQGVVAPDLISCRPHHHERLDKAYPDGGVRIWMEKALS